MDDKAIIHRDIKLPNILLHDGPTPFPNPPFPIPLPLTPPAGRLKLADFGISKVLSGEYAKTVMGGTPHYMAPELMSKNQYVACVWNGFWVLKC